MTWKTFFKNCRKFQGFQENIKKTRSPWQLKRSCAEAPPWSQQPVSFSSHKYCESRDKDFSKSHMTSCWPHEQRAMWLEEWESFIVSHHPTEFAVNRHFVRRDIMALVCHVILQVHVIKGLCDYLGGNSSFKFCSWL